MSLHSEILEQPACLDLLLRTQRQNIEEIASRIRQQAIHYAFVAARGTSDNAARYAQYLWGAANHLPLALATPSLFTYYQQPPLLNGALVVGISQSGQSPDIVRVVEEGRRQGSCGGPYEYGDAFTFDQVHGPGSRIQSRLEVPHDLR